MSDAQNITGYAIRCWMNKRGTREEDERTVRWYTNDIYRRFRDIPIGTLIPEPHILEAIRDLREFRPRCITEAVKITVETEAKP